MNISGGTVIVDGPVNDGNGALDSGTEINVSGGILIAAGSLGVWREFPSDTSTQPSLVVRVRTIIGRRDDRLRFRIKTVKI